jgi:dihydrofolate reductase
MNCFIIAAISADGFIAQSEKLVSLQWTSKEDKKRFIELTKHAGVVVMGSTTFLTLPKPLKDRINIVYSRDINKKIEGAEVTQDAPIELLKKLEARGFGEVAICGGSHIYSLFIKAKAVNKLYLTVEPILFGNGIRLFNEENVAKLKLLNMEKTETGTLLLEYEVNY